MGRLPRLPLTVLVYRAVGVGQESLSRGQLAYCRLVTDRHQRSYDIVREQHVLVVFSREPPTETSTFPTLYPRFPDLPSEVRRERMHVYNTAVTIHQYVK